MPLSSDSAIYVILTIKINNNVAVSISTQLYHPETGEQHLSFSQSSKTSTDGHRSDVMETMRLNFFFEIQDLTIPEELEVTQFVIFSDILGVQKNTRNIYNEGK